MVSRTDQTFARHLEYLTVCFQDFRFHSNKTEVPEVVFSGYTVKYHDKIEPKVMQKQTVAHSISDGSSRKKKGLIHPGYCICGGLSGKFPSFFERYSKND